MVRALAVVGGLGVAGCFAPAPATGLPCTAAGDCPAGQHCDPVSSTCVLALADAAGAADGPADAPPGQPDARGDAASIDAAGLGPWGAPVNLTTVNSTVDEDDPCLTADRLELFFASRRPGLGIRDLWVSTRAAASDPWGVPVASPLNTALDDYGPEISPDGLTLHFISSRGGGVAVYVTTRPTRAAPFVTPVLDSLDGTGSEQALAISSDRLVSVVDRVGNMADRELYQRLRPSPTAAWGAELRLVSLSSIAEDGAPALGADGTVIYFHSERDTPGVDDLFWSQRTTTADAFVAPLPITELNTAVSDGDPFVTDDGRMMLFHSSRPGGVGGRDLWMSTR